jgi:transcriptional regulator of met regulon
MPTLGDMTPEQRAQAAQLFTFVKANPDIEKEIRRKAKEKNPAMHAPDIEIEQALKKQREEIEAELAKDRQERLDTIKAERRKEAHALIRTAGLDPEAVEKVMVDENIGNYQTAINYILAQKKLAPATPHSMTPHTLPDNKDLWADRNKWSKTQAFAAINEIIAGRKSA